MIRNTKAVTANNGGGEIKKDYIYLKRDATILRELQRREILGGNAIIVVRISVKSGRGKGVGSSQRNI